jgi:hypothetical protein
MYINNMNIKAFRKELKTRYPKNEGWEIFVRTAKKSLLGYQDGADIYIAAAPHLIEDKTWRSAFKASCVQISNVYDVYRLYVYFNGPDEAPHYALPCKESDNSPRKKLTRLFNE